MKSGARHLLPLRGDRPLGVFRAGRPPLPAADERRRLEQDGEGAGSIIGSGKYHLLIF